jgi:hypothetical protein
MSNINKIIPEEDDFEKKEDIEPDDMRPEYDFTDGVRGKHYQAYQQGHTVKIHQVSGNIIEQHFTLEEGAVFIEADVRQYFPDAESVNRALRGLIALFPKDKLIPASQEEAKESV